MSVTIYRSKVLTKDDLNIFIYNTDGVTFFNPFSITYTIYHTVYDQFNIENYVENYADDEGLFNQEKGEEPVREAIDLIPVPFGIGKFFAAWQMSEDITVGGYRIKWHIRKFSDTPILQAVEVFQIIDKNDSINFSQMNGGPMLGAMRLPTDKFGNENIWAG
jgi:hypothetical protein